MKIIFSNVQPNSKESKIWLNEKGQLRTYNQKQQKWAQSSISSKPEDEPVYENGVFAVTADYKLIDYNTADSSCIGVALITDNQRIMISKADATDGTNYNLYWGYNLYGKDIAGITETTDSSAAKADFNGRANTAAIIAAYSQHNVAMDAKDMCKALETFNAGSDNQGHTDWYIPAAGQLALIYLAKSDINAALAKIGGTTFDESDYHYWSSSECDANYVWFVYFYDGDVSSFDKYIDGRVRFIRDL